MRWLGPFVLGILFAGSGSAQAAPLTWNLVNVSFGDGTTVTGSFVFDADTATFSNLNIATSGGSSVPADNTWFFGTCFSCKLNTFPNSGFLATDQTAADLTGAHVISLFSIDGELMTNAGGVITLEFFRAGTCLTADCTFYNPDLPNSTTGSGQFSTSANTAAVPEPATLLLVGGGIAGLKRWRRKRSRG